MLKTSNPRDCYKICRITKTDRAGNKTEHYIVKYLWHFLGFFPVWIAETDEQDIYDDEDVREFKTLIRAKEYVDKCVKSAMTDIVETKIECDVS